MKTLQIEIQDDLYNTIKDSSIDINNKVKEFLYNLVDDGYSTISTSQARSRVAQSIENYKNNNTKYSKYDKNFKDEMNQFIESI